MFSTSHPFLSRLSIHRSEGVEVRSNQSSAQNLTSVFLFTQWNCQNPTSCSSPDLSNLMSQIIFPLSLFQSSLLPFCFSAPSTCIGRSHSHHWSSFRNLPHLLVQLFKSLLKYRLSEAFHDHTKKKWHFSFFSAFQHLSPFCVARAWLVFYIYYLFPPLESKLHEGRDFWRGIPSA